jgi:methionine aminopeptidase
MKHVVEKGVAGIKIFDLCEFGDSFIKTEVEKVYTDAKGANGKPIVKGTKLRIKCVFYLVFAAFTSIDLNSTRNQMMVQQILESNLIDFYEFENHQHSFF